MYGRLFGFFAIAAVGTATIFAQTPEPKKSGVDTFVWQMNDGGYLGVQTTEITKENFGKFGLREVRGVAVEKVIDGSPAANAGIQVGDVLISFNGDPVTSSRKLIRLLGEVSPDQTAKVLVVRGGTERELSVTVGKRPMPRFEEGNFNFEFPRDFPNVQMPRMPEMPSMGEMPRVQAIPRMPNFPNEDFVWHMGPSRQIGIGVMPLSQQLAEHFGVDGGVLVNDVRPDSPAAKAGLKAGDIIVEAEGRAVRGDGDVIRAISEKKEGDVTLTIVRNGNRQTVKVTPEEHKGGFNFEYPTPPARVPGRVNAVPATPGMAPVPLDQFMVRGRII